LAVGAYNAPLRLGLREVLFRRRRRAPHTMNDQRVTARCPHRTKVVSEATSLLL
jgi:hypothetical protein